MDADQPSRAPLPEQQRRDVAVADERLRRPAKGLRVESVQDARRAVATPRADDRGDLGIVHELHQLGRPAIVVAREIAAAIEQIAPPTRLEPELAKPLLARIDELCVDGSGGCGDADDGALADRTGFAEGGQAGSPGWRREGA